MSHDNRSDEGNRLVLYDGQQRVDLPWIRATLVTYLPIRRIRGDGMLESRERITKAEEICFVESRNGSGLTSAAL